MNSTPRERMIAALERCPPLPGPVPHWELVFFPTMEAFGKVSSVHRNYSQWLQMSERERELHRIDIAELAIAIAEKYEHNAISVLPAPWESQEFCRLAEKIRERSGDRYLLIAHADGTQAIPSGGNMEQFSYRLIDEPQKLKDESMRAIEQLLRDAVSWRAAGIEAVAMCSDYCMNAGPFLSPELFAEFVTPFLKLQVAELRKLGFYTIKHTDGNIMPIIDQLAECAPDALHSLDPQGGVDIAEVKKRYGDRLCLIGNVNCGLMDTGTDAEVAASAEYALRHGMPGGGYVFSTSNCIYTGMPLEHYELILKIRHEKGVYPLPPADSSDEKEEA